MAESFELPDETERLQVNLEDDVRSFLISRLTGNQMDPKKRAQLEGLGVNVRRLSKPSYLSVKSDTDMPEEGGDIHDCHVGAEGYMVHRDEEVVHLAFKCGNKTHEMHYTKFLPLSIAELAKAMEAVWPGSILSPLLEQAVKLGRARSGPVPPGFFIGDRPIELSQESAEKLLDTVRRMDEEGPDFDFDEALDDVDIDEDLEDSTEDEDDLFI